MEGTGKYGDRPKENTGTGQNRSQFEDLARLNFLGLPGRLGCGNQKRASFASESLSTIEYGAEYRGQAKTIAGSKVEFV